MGAVQSISFTPAWPAALQPKEPTLCDKVAQVAWDIFSVIIFPIGLIRLAYYWINRLVAHLLFPSMTILPSALLDDLRRILGGERVRFPTPDNVHLDGMFFKGERPDKVILYVGGNGSAYETSLAPRSPHAFLRRSKASIFAFNCENTGDSKGFPDHPDRLRLDVYSAYEYLIRVKKIAPENILLYGMSMGGCSGNRGAALVQKKYPDRPLSAINERSFDNLANEVRHLVNHFTGCPCLGEISAGAIHALNWQMDSAAAWEELKGNKYIIYHELDGVIPLEASLQQATKQGERMSMRIFGQKERSFSYHNYHFLPEEGDAILRKIDAFLGIESSDALLSYA